MIYSKKSGHTLNQKKIKPIIYKTMSIENANQAHEIMEKDENIGKLVLEIN